MPRGSRTLPAGCARLLETASLIVHVGDLTSVSFLEELRRLGPVEAVHGNMDEPDLKTALPDRRTLEAGGLRIGLVHDPGPSAGRHERLLQWFQGCNLVVYGHTHEPELVRRQSVWIVNPGSPTERRLASHHTMAVVRAGRPELVRLE
jgi:uncharacterized protein